MEFTLHLRLYRNAMLAWVFMSGTLYPQGPETFDDKDPWQLAAMLFSEQSLEEFRTLQERPETASRKNTYGIALQMLNAPNKSPALLQKTKDLFTQLIKENSTDNIGKASRYYLGRIEQVHDGNGDLEKAKTILLQLSEDYPQDLWGQLAFLKYATQYLYEADTQEMRFKRLKIIRDKASFVDIPAVKRNLLMTLGDVALFYQVSEIDALNDYLQAKAIGFRKRSSREKILLRIAKIAKNLDKQALLISTYEEFVAAFPRHTHTHRIREELAALKVSPHHEIR